MNTRASPQARNAWLHLNGARAEAFRQLTAGLTPEQVLVVPLDIGKNVIWAGFHTRDGCLLADPLELSALQSGFTQFTTTLDALIAKQQPRLVLLGHEPTGIYHLNWARALLARYDAQLHDTATPRFRYHFLNPFQVKLNRTQATAAFNKTDLLDLGAIGDLLARGFGTPAHLPEATTFLIRPFGRSARCAPCRLSKRAWNGACSPPSTNSGRMPSSTRAASHARIRRSLRPARSPRARLNGSVCRPSSRAVPIPTTCCNSDATD